jgi:hypothetical protein
MYSLRLRARLSQRKEIIKLRIRLIEIKFLRLRLTRKVYWLVTCAEIYRIFNYLKKILRKGQTGGLSKDH